LLIIFFLAVQPQSSGGFDRNPTDLSKDLHKLHQERSHAAQPFSPASYTSSTRVCIFSPVMLFVALVSFFVGMVPCGTVYYYEQDIFCSHDSCVFSLYVNLVRNMFRVQECFLAWIFRWNFSIMYEDIEN
jgi:hypothetical protein